MLAKESRETMVLDLRVVYYHNNQNLSWRGAHRMLLHGQKERGVLWKLLLITRWIAELARDHDCMF